MYSRGADGTGVFRDTVGFGESVGEKDLTRLPSSAVGASDQVVARAGNVVVDADEIDKEREQRLGACRRRCREGETRRYGCFLFHSEGSLRVVLKIVGIDRGETAELIVII